MSATMNDPEYNQRLTSTLDRLAALEAKLGFEPLSYVEIPTKDYMKILDRVDKKEYALFYDLLGAAFEGQDETANAEQRARDSGDVAADPRDRQPEESDVAGLLVLERAVTYYQKKHHIDSIIDEYIAWCEASQDQSYTEWKRKNAEYRDEIGALAREILQFVTAEDWRTFLPCHPEPDYWAAVSQRNTWISTPEEQEVVGVLGVLPGDSTLLLTAAVIT